MSKLMMALNYYMESVGDPRTANLFLVSAPMLPIILCLAYLAIVLIIGPKFMENRKPFELKNSMMLYNIIQVVFCAYIAYVNGSNMIRYQSFFKGNDIDFSNSVRGQREILGCYLFYINKYLDFVDTFFFILRKKNNQISFLHVYHHATVPLVNWVIVNYYPGGNFACGAFFNSLVHVIMYSYYFLAGLGPQVQKYLWWKKYITTLQLGQFLFGVFHLTMASITGCNIPNTVLLFYAFYIFTFFILFFNFYQKNYITKKSLKNVDKNSKTEVTQPNGSIKTNKLLVKLS